MWSAFIRRTRLHDVPSLWDHCLSCKIFSCRYSWLGKEKSQLLLFDDFEEIFRLVRAPMALSRMRIDLAVRPCLPITRPKSSFATRNSSTDAVSLLVS
jgi:hypothetical protein